MVVGIGRLFYVWSRKGEGVVSTLCPEKVPLYFCLSQMLTDFQNSFTDRLFFRTRCSSTFILNNSRRPRRIDVKCSIYKSVNVSVTFRVSHRRREMYCGHARLCVCVSVPGRMPTLLHGPGCNLWAARGCPLVMHYWADLQSVHELRCYSNITRTQNVSEYMLVLALCLVSFVFSEYM